MSAVPGSQGAPAQLRGSGAARPPIDWVELVIFTSTLLAVVGTALMV